MVNHLGQDKGLVQLNANALTQDENGFLWVGTEDGLHRFNGYEFKLFTASPNDSNSIQDDHIRGLYAKGDTLWIASNTKGILGYQLSKNTFFALKKNNKNLLNRDIEDINITKTIEYIHKTVLFFFLLLFKLNVFDFDLAD